MTDYSDMTGAQLDRDHSVVVAPDSLDTTAGHGDCTVCGLEVLQEGADPRTWEHVDHGREDQFGPGPSTWDSARDDLIGDG